MRYETLDTIADSYIPILFLGYIVYSTLYWRAGDRLAALKGLLGVMTCYVIMWIDTLFHLWPRLGLDYSTHTAVACAFIIFHLHKRLLSTKAAVACMLSFMGYLILMRYQNYHSFMDMFATLLIVVPLIVATYGLGHCASKNISKHIRRRAV